MEGFEARVLNRFKWGMTQELERPDMELRRDVLRRKAEQDGLNLPDDVIDFIAANVTDSIREIVGVVASLMGRAMVLGCDVNLDLARKVVSNVVKINEHRLDFELIVDRVANYYGIESDKLFTKSRKREISDMRQVVMYLAKAMANMSLKAIGSRLGRSHATVLYGCNTIEQRLGVDRKLTEEIKSIEDELKAV